jgi:hypothetical protein
MALFINDRLERRDQSPQADLMGFPNVVAVVLFKEDFSDHAVQSALPLLASRFCPAGSHGTPPAAQVVVQEVLNNLFAACELRQQSGSN